MLCKVLLLCRVILLCKVSHRARAWQIEYLELEGRDGRSAFTQVWTNSCLSSWSKRAGCGIKRSFKPRASSDLSK